MIRIVNLNDASAIAAIYSPYVTDMATSFEAVPPTEEEMRMRIESRKGKLPWLVYEQDGIVYGYAYASQFNERVAYRWSAEVSVYVQTDHHRCGIGRALYAPLFEILRAQGFITLIAGITLPNESSAMIHETMGFKPCGVYKNIGFKFGNWHDVGRWQMQIGEQTDSPSEPRRLNDVINGPTWELMLSSGSQYIRPSPNST